MKNDFLLVGPLVPVRTNWLQTEFSVLNLGKQSLNISLIRDNCLSDRFISDQEKIHSSPQPLKLFTVVNSKYQLS